MDKSRINSFSDQDSRVRYYACEALYNIAKTVRGDFIVFFNKIFDALCKLSADSDPNVQSAAHLLDRLVKDIVTESDQFSSCSPTAFKWLSTNCCERWVEPTKNRGIINLEDVSF